MSRQPGVAGLSVCGLVLVFALSAIAQNPTPVQTDDRAPEAPKFHAESRQVLVEANVWKPGATKHATNLKSKADLQPPKGWPTPAVGLTIKDFHIFDNGLEQRINFFKELDFDAHASGPWLMRYELHGAWGTYDPPYLSRGCLQLRISSDMPQPHSSPASVSPFQ